MLEKILAFALRNRPAVLLFTGLLAIAGGFAFKGLTVEAFPDPTDTQVNVITLFPGQPSEEVERQLGLPLERALNGMPGLARLRSLSLFGLSFVTMTFEDGVDANFARQLTVERLRDADLPEGVSAQLGPLATPIGEVYRYTLRGAGGDPMKLRTAQDWVVRPRLLRVPGVAEVVSYGGLVREIHVQPSPVRLAAFDLTLQDLERALREGSVNATGGTLEHGAEQFVIRSKGLFTSHADVANTAVTTRAGTPIRVRDVAEVREGWAPRQGVVSRESTFDTVEGIVLMRRGQNPSAVLEALREVITKLNVVLPSRTGTQMEIVPFYDRTDLVSATLKTVARNLAEGGVLVCVVLLVFLMDWRAAAIVAALIPLSLLGAFLYLRVRGMSANLLSMGAVDFGIIVDGAVVIIESIVARMAYGGLPTGAVSVRDRVEQATRAVLRPTVFALLIIIAAYLPIFLLERVEGRIFAPMSNTVVAALVAALVLSVTLVPVLATFAYARPRPHRDSPVFTLAQSLYHPILKASLRRPALVLVLAGGALLAAVVILPRLGSEFLPELNEGSLYVTCTLPSNVSLSEGRKMVPKLTSLLSAAPEVQEILSQLGRPEDGTDATLSNNLEFFVRLKPPSEWPQGDGLSQVIGRLSRSVAELPGVEVNFSQPIRDNVNENISGQFGQIAVKVYGEDLGVLQNYAEKMKSVIARVYGVADLGIVKSGEVPQIQVNPDREALARYGLSLGAFQHVFQAAVGGINVGTFWEGEIPRDLVLRISASSRDDMEKIRSLPIAVEGGVTVPLALLAHVDVGVGRASINRENGRRYIGIRMNVRGRDMGSFVTEAQAAVAAQAPLPAGVVSEWGGEFENKQRAMARLAVVVPVALLITLALLFNAFKNLRLALLTLANVPFALVGGVAGLALFGMPVSVAAAVGFIALIGQASLNGVLVLSAVEDLHRGGASRREAIVRGCLARLRPVLMTGALAALGLVPAALSHAMGAETQRPIAVVIVGGTLSAALLTLVVLPVMYDLVGAIAERLESRGSRPAS